VNILPSLIIQLLENFRPLVWAEVFKHLAQLINGLPAGAADLSLPKFLREMLGLFVA
jgi:hypothetical protein